MGLLLVAVLIFLFNTFFGYWRSSTRRFSVQWLMAIHIPVALAIVTRLLLLEWDWATVPIFVAAFITGQYVGGIIKSYLVEA